MSVLTGKSKSKDMTILCQATIKKDNMLKQVSNPYIQRINNRNYSCAKFEKINGEVVEKIIRDSKHGTHYMSNDRIYSIWKHMKYRCSNPNVKKYKYYGGKGISVCDEWTCSDGFINFYNWAINNGYEDNLTIDRIDSDGNYEPINCRWLTHSENARLGTCKPHYPKYKYIGINKTLGIMFYFYKTTDMEERYGIDSRRVSDCCNNRRKDYKGWEFKREELIVEGQETIPKGSTMEDEFPLEVQAIQKG